MSDETNKICHILRCGNPLIEFAMCENCNLNMCETCANNLFINGKQICPKCTFGGNFEGLFPGISKVRCTQDHGISILSTNAGRYQLIDRTDRTVHKYAVHKYAVYTTRERNILILVFRLQDGKGERFMKFSLYIEADKLMVRLHSPLNITGGNDVYELSFEDTFKPNLRNPVYSSLTPEFDKAFNGFRNECIARKYNMEPFLGVQWWETMISWFGPDYIQFFRPNKSRRRGSKSVKRHRKLRSKSKSRKRSSKPRRR